MLKIYLDYTEWQSEHLYIGMTFEEISDHAIKVIEERFDELPESIQRDISNRTL